ncbi:MAG TPA: ClpXP protease specificity-enhancing factor [Xanthomonadales bacterium]|nr:ClpXP protease specificity-enhancing factor [Xanthomonadales bacterium]
MTVTQKLTSNRPYLVRAMYDWISDNGLTPYLLVDARAQGVQVPQGAIKDGQIVLNVAVRAVSDLELGNQSIRFVARFSGVSHQVDVPVSSVLAIYAQENGQGMMFPAESGEPGSVTGSPDQPEPPKKGPTLRVVK